jgi:hypothetical protein
MRAAFAGRVSVLFPEVLEVRIEDTAPPVHSLDVAVTVSSNASKA